MQHSINLGRLVCFASIVVGGIAACGGEVDDQNAMRLSPVAALTGNTDNGRTRFLADCASCHGAAGGGGIGPNLMGEDDGDEIVEAMLTGPDQMPVFSSYSDQTLADVRDFVRSL